MIGQFSRWVTAFHRTPPRTVIVTKVEPSSETVRFRFEDTGATSACSDSAFRRTYTEAT